MIAPSPPRPTAVRVARPCSSLTAAAGFYVDLVGLPELSRFADHDGFSGLIVGLPGDAHQLEFLSGPGGHPNPTPTPEDLLVLYLPVGEHEAIVRRLRSAGQLPVSPLNPYWTKIEALHFVDPDNYGLVLVPG